MPGLIGFVGHLPPAEGERLLREMARRLTVQDTEHVDLYLDPGVGLGRVALPFAAGAAQPIWNEDRSLCVVMEGEVYDYADEKRRLVEAGHHFRTEEDAEYVLHLYEEHGESFALRLNGPFVAAIWSPEKRRLLVVNDRWGLQPLFYAQADGRLLIASGARAILADPACPPRVHPVGLAEFLTFEHVLENRTLFEGVRLLPPASILVWEGDRLAIRPYWEFGFVETCDDRPETWYIEGWLHHVRQAVRRCRKGEVPEGVLLSGGLDSRTVLAAMDGARGQVHTFTFGAPGCDDARLAREVATKVRTRHHFVPFRPEDLPQIVEEGVWLSEGLNSAVHMHVLAALPEATRWVQVVYTGSLGDSIMGQHLYRPLVGFHPDELLTRMLFRQYNTAFSEERLSRLLTPSVYRQVRGVAFEAFRRTLGESRAALSANRREYYSIRQDDRRWILEGQRLLRSRLIVRTPFYDNDLVAFMVRVPLGLRLEGYLYRRAFAVAFPDLAKIPLEATGEPLVPCMRGAVTGLTRQLRWKFRSVGLRFVPPPRRRPYADYDRWMRTTLRPWVEGVLLDRRALGRGFFDPQAVRALVEEHMAGHDHARRLGVLLTFELWCRKFLDGDGGVEG